jgi:hypothetical protein
MDPLNEADASQFHERQTTNFVWFFRNIALRRIGGLRRRTTGTAVRQVCSRVACERIFVSRDRW